MEKEIKALAEAGKRAEAIRLAEEYLQRQENDEAVLLLLGELLYADGKMTDAMNKFNAVLRLNPEHTKAQNYVTMIRNVLDYFCKDLLNP